jgi:hypothetical protein
LVPCEVEGRILVQHIRQMFQKNCLLIEFLFMLERLKYLVDARRQGIMIELAVDLNIHEGTQLKMNA